MSIRKRIFALILVLVLLCGMLPGVVHAGEDAPVMAAFYVSPTGSDRNDGLSQQSPFATLERARDAVRAVNANMTGDIVVYLMDGVWELSDTLRFDERDSGTNGHFVCYQALPGAKPVVSGGRQLDADWTVAGEVNWLRGGLVAYKTPLVRNDKLRAVYVNDQRASMTRKTLQPKRSVGSYSITAGQADWAWVSGSKPSGNVFNSADLPADARNPRNIELESGSTWVKAQVCAASLQDIGGGETQVNFQMPYAAIAQSLLWNCAYTPTGRNDVTNVFEWLSKAGEFYFDQAGGMLYYIPRPGEDIHSAEVVVPELDQLIDVRGSVPMEKYAENIIFDGIKFAYTDWNLVEVGGSHGNCTQQGATILTKYSGNWHNDIYRAYDIPPAAIQINTAKNVRVLNGEVSNTGYLGLHLENDVWDCDVTGNFIARTGGAGVVIGHLQHVYENDTPAHRVGNGAPNTKEKFPAGTESAPKHIRITNNYLLENCYFFPGNSPITSFYTYDMQVLHNFIYKCSYSGMSIGWGWCEFDGTSSSQLPGMPTTTSRANTVSNNRVEEICSILQDAGGIYTLGQQGNEDWTDVTVMNNNYINASRTPQQADGSRMVNGFHPDEGSAYILLDGNVVTNIIRNVYELNNWQRKHDVIVTNGFSNTDRSETTAPNCTLEQYVNADYIWPLLGCKTVLDSGLENEYVHMIGKDVIADTEYELASNVRLDAGLTLPRRGLLSAQDTVWIAPAGTAAFAEGPTMTRAAGNETGIVMPETPGVYKLYIAYADGSVSAPSLNTIYLGEAKRLANVENGARCSVSAVRPLVLELDDDNYRFTLSGRSVKSGEKIDGPGVWALTAQPIVGDAAPTVIGFETFVSESNRLLPKTLTVKAGEPVALADDLNDPGLRLWLASGSASAFKESYSMTSASGDSTVINAPLLEGVYDLSVVDANGDILNRSDALVKVVRGADYLLADGVEDGKQYVVVSNGYALTDGPDGASATPVAVREDRVVSPVRPEMLWTFSSAEDGYCLKNDAGAYLGADLRTGAARTVWTLTALDGGELALTHADKALRGEKSGFSTAPGTAPLRLYEAVPVKGLESVDFTDPDSAGTYEIIGKTNAAQSARGLMLRTTRNAIEPCNGQNSGARASTPEDLVRIPVDGDWTATLRFSFDPTANNGYYQFFGFYAATDYQNMVGVRGGDGAMQDFLRIGGEVTAETKSSGPGLAEAGTYWLRVVKEGDSYTCFRSADGERFTRMFDFADTGIEADRLLIDAYTGMTEGYTFYLEHLALEQDARPQTECEHEYVEEVIPPTCTGAGQTVHTCIICGSEYTDGLLPALGHSFGEWRVSKAAACTQKGEETRVCSRCDAVETRETAALGHDYKAAVTEPTCEQAGFTTCTCARCGDSYRTDETAALGHDYKDGVCTRCGKADPDYVPPEPFRFDDVKDESQYFFTPVYWAVEREITNGATPTAFHPDAGCTRAQVVTFLWRAAGKPEPDSSRNPFTDVPESQYYYKAVLWAVEKGVTRGTSADRFSPNATCTRGQIVTFLWRYFGEPDPEGRKNPFADVSEGQYYYKAILWAMEKEITRGTSADKFSPGATCTRAQIVTFLYRSMK